MPRPPPRAPPPTLAMRFGARGRARESLRTPGGAWGPPEERPGSAEDRSAFGRPSEHPWQWIRFVFSVVTLSNWSQFHTRHLDASRGGAMPSPLAHPLPPSGGAGQIQKGRRRGTALSFSQAMQRTSRLGHRVALAPNSNRAASVRAAGRKSILGGFRSFL